MNCNHIHDWPWWAYLMNAPFVPLALPLDYIQYQVYCNHLEKLATYEELQVYEDYNWGMTYPNQEVLEKVDEEAEERLKEKQQQNQRYRNGNPKNRREALEFWICEKLGVEPEDHLEKLEKLPTVEIFDETCDGGVNNE